jgi:EmrB/QacA subfamily drug resistance transporter
LSASDKLRSFFTIRVPLAAWIVATAFFMETLDSTIIVTALPEIAKSFRVTALDAGIGVTVYLMAIGAMLPASAWLADRFGPRNLFASAVALFTLSSIACAMSENLLTFALARVVQGGAGALMSPVGRMVVLRTTPKDRVIEALGMITWPGLLGPVIGPPIGGLLATYASWHWIFLINVPLGVAGVVLAMRCITNERGPRRPFDWPNFILTAMALSGLLLGMALLAQSTADATGPLALIVVGIGLGVLAVLRMRRVDHPLLQLDVAMVPTFFVSNLSAGWLTRAAMNATPFLTPLLFQLGFGMTPFSAGLMLLPYFLGNVLAKTITTPLYRGLGFARVLLLTSIGNALFIGALAVLPNPAANWLIAIFVVVLFAAGVSRSINMTGLTTLSFADIPKERTSDATALNSTFWQLAAAFGVAAAAVILRFSALAHQAETATEVDFRIAMGVAALACLIASVIFGALKADTGAALTAPGPGPAAPPAPKGA